ncbi:hypothetical protein BHE74_00056545 [Ensete ventricosum]|nr:hypothetical protein BHE74_00056545 [Ensete ventricosum]
MGNGSRKRILPLLRLLLPSSSFTLPQLNCSKSSVGSRNRLLQPYNCRQRLKLILTDRFRVVTGWKQPQLAVPPDSGRSAYRSAGELVPTT